MKVVAHKNTPNQITYSLVLPNGKRFVVYYQKWTSTYTWTGTQNDNDIFDAIMVYTAKRNAWWSLPLFATLLCLVLWVAP
jgi:hypothetical protein